MFLIAGLLRENYFMQIHVPINARVSKGVEMITAIKGPYYRYI